MKRLIFTLFLMLVFSCPSMAQESNDLLQIKKMNMDEIIIGKTKKTVNATFYMNESILWNGQNGALYVQNLRTKEFYIFTQAAFESKSVSSAADYIITCKASTRSTSGIIRIGQNKEKFGNEKRIALLIGNSNYIYEEFLKNPVCDVESVSSELVQLGFDTYSLFDCTSAQMRSALSSFKKKAEGYDVALFYYAGHGLSWGNRRGQPRSYYIPVDVELEREEHLRDCIEGYELLDQLELENRTTFVFLDACRSRKRSWARGLDDDVKVQMEPPKNMTIVYSTTDGSVAFDGDGSLSPFAEGFINSLHGTNVSFFDCMIGINRYLAEKTDYRQSASFSGVPMASFYFTSSSNAVENISPIKKSYLEITDISFANVDKNNQVLTNYGDSLYEHNVEFIIPKVTYRSSESKSLNVKVRIFSPNNVLLIDQNSTEDFTFEDTVSISAGENNTFSLHGWGKEYGGFPTSGDFKYEIWENNNQLCSSSFKIYKKDGLMVNNHTGFVETEFPSKGGMVTYTIKNAYTWSVSRVPRWCSVLNRTPTSFVIKSSPNLSPDQRVGSFTVEAYGKKVNITITQKAGSDTTDFNVQEGGNIPLKKSENQQSNYQIVNDEIGLSRIKDVLSKGLVEFGKEEYRGQISSSGRRMGFGISKTEDESLYLGEWLDGKIHGTGILIAPTGTFVDNCPQCTYYVGYFFAGYKASSGACFDKNGKLIYDGEFTSNRPREGYPRKRSSARRFECIQYGNGSIYFGETYIGIPHGKGIYVSEKGYAWFGTWSDGVKNGEGISFYDDGSVTIEKWKRGKLVTAE